MLPRVLLLPLALFATTLAGGGEASKARTPTVDTLDFFGLRRLTEAEIRAKLPFKEGDAFRRADTKSIEAALEKIPGVQKASLSPITVSGGSLRLFVGIQEEGATGFKLRDAPTGEQRLPEAAAQIYRDCMSALGPAVRKGTAREDHSQGHALSDDPDMRKAEDAAIVFAKAETPLLQEILKSCGSDDDRCAAAWLLGYAPDKKLIIADLVEAARDPDGSVRNNATRALGVIADYAAANPKLGIRIDPTIFIAMLGSVTWTDLNKASFLLEGLTKDRPPELLRVLREQALPQLTDIARWKSEGHAYPGIRILGQIAGWKDDQIMKARGKDGVEKIIAAAASTK
jgi:hypothetical protein